MRLWLGNAYNQYFMIVLHCLSDISLVVSKELNQNLKADRSFCLPPAVGSSHEHFIIQPLPFTIHFLAQSELLGWARELGMFQSSEPILMPPKVSVNLILNLISYGRF
jgi:hypothetical protein